MNNLSGREWFWVRFALANWIAAFLLVLAIAYFIYPTPYLYYTAPPRVCRVHRGTGKAEISGYVPPHSADYLAREWTGGPDTPPEENTDLDFPSE